MRPSLLLLLLRGAVIVSCALSFIACAGTQSDDDVVDDEPLGSTSSRSMIGNAALTTAEERWIDHVDDQVVARLSGASQQERAHTAAVVTWWALKEGVLDVAPNPWRHNLCTQNGRDVQIGDTGVCWGPAWQVGLSGIQVNNVTQQQVENTASRLYPGESMSTILRRIATTAGLGESAITTVASSTGALRKSWLLRDPAIGITLQRPFVESECLNNGLAWCFGSWDTARKFASSSARIREVIAELEKRFMSGSSQPPPPPQGKRCPLGNGLYCGGNHIQGNASTLYNCNETNGITVHTQQCSKGCQRMPDGENDRCAL
jgi:hypothetical protein